RNPEADRKPSKSTPSHCPGDLRRQKRWRHRDARRRGPRPSADDENFHAWLLERNRPTDTFVRGLQACRMRRNAIALRWAVSCEPNAYRRWLRHGNRAGHAAIIPARPGRRGISAIARNPEMRMTEIDLASPFPIFWAPVFRHFVSASLHEPEVFAVGHREHVDGETRHQNLLLAKFVVPPESAFGAGLAQRGDARRDGYLARLRAGPVVFIREWRDIFFVRGETVQQVRQSLGVHQAMLD